MDIVDELFDLGGSLQQCIIHGKAIVEIERLREKLTKLDKDIEELKKTIETLEEEVYLRTSEIIHANAYMDHKE